MSVNGRTKNFGGYKCKLFLALILIAISIPSRADDCRKFKSITSDQSSYMVKLMGQAWRMERIASDNSSESFEKYEKSRSSFSNFINDGKSKLGDCYTGSWLEVRAKDFEAKVQEYDKKHASIASVYQERLKKAEDASRNVDMTYKDEDVLLTIDKVSDPGNITLIKLQVQAINDKRIIRISTHKSWSEVAGEKLIGGDFPFGFSLTDDLGNDYPIHMIEPKIVDLNMKSLRLGQSELLEIRFKDTILPTASRVQLRIEQGILGNKATVVIVVPKDVIH